MAKQKLVRIDLSTAPQDILATMREELPVEMYHFRKPYGGTRKYAKYEDELLDKALGEEKSQMTEMSEHISRSGNRWLTYTMVDYYPRAQYAYATHISFVYYETYGSCGAFFPLYQPNEHKDLDGVMIFTSHFFLRMSERTGKAYRSKALVQEFASTKVTNAIQVDEEGEVIVKFKGGYGFGVLKSEMPRVMEIRTYLTDGQLSGKQRRKVDKLNAMSELMEGGAYLNEVALHTALNNVENPQEAMEKGLRDMKNIKKLGLEQTIAVQVGASSAFCKMLDEMLHTTFSTKHHVLAAHTFTMNAASFIAKYSKEGMLDGNHREEFAKDLVDVFCLAARKMGLKSITRDRVTEYVNNLMKTEG